jgi:hypothetical protein
MPRIEGWGRLPAGVRQPLTDRIRDWAISKVGLNRLASGSNLSRRCPETTVFLGQAAKGSPPTASVLICRHNWPIVMPALT